MFLIDYVKPEEADGKIAKMYKMFPPQIGIPLPLQIYSASPEMLRRQATIIEYLSTHAKIEPLVQAAIRYISACHFKADACIEYNGKLLKAAGVTDDQLVELSTNPGCVYDGKDATLLNFVAKAVATPEAINEADVDAARTAGWDDSDLFDAVAQGAQMSVVGTVVKAFKK